MLRLYSNDVRNRAVLRTVVALVGIVLVIAVATLFAFALPRAGEASMFLWMGIPTVMLAALGARRAQHDGVLKDWMSVRAGDFTRGFVGAAVLFGAAWGTTRMVAPTGSVREAWLVRLYLQLGDPSTLRKNVVLVVAAMIVIVIAEEILWRGLVTALLAEKMGSRRAWVWAAVLYAVAHAPTAFALRDPLAGYNPLVVLGALGGGLVWGLLARTFGRLWPGIFAHLLFNWAVLMMFRL